MKKSLRAALVVACACLLGAGCSLFPFTSETRGAIVFYKKGKTIFVRQCEDAPRFTSLHDCKTKGGTVLGEVPEYDFINRLKLSLFVTVEYTLAGDNQKVLDVVNKEDPAAVDRKRNEAIRISKQLAQFIDAYEKNFPDKKNAMEYRKKLDGFKERVARDSELNPAIDNINELIDEVVEQAFTSPSLEKLIFSNSSQKFEFNVLVTYVQIPNISSQFIRLEYKPPGKKASTQFEIQETEVTQGQWVQVMGYNRSSFKTPKICPKDFKEINGMKVCPNHPVENVSWEDAQKFIRKINETNSQYTYRLPTDAEWQFAASGGNPKGFSFGNDIKQLAEYAWYGGNAGVMPMQVKTRKPNAFGIYDMIGNLWEWVQEDADTAIIAYRKGPQPSALSLRPSALRIIRGGGWFNEAQLQTSRSRDRVLSDHGCPGVGFRLARTLRLTK